MSGEGPPVVGAIRAPHLERTLKTAEENGEEMLYLRLLKFL